MSNVVGLKEYRTMKQYSSMIHLNLALDTVHKPRKREITKEMTKGYLTLLSNNKNN